MAKKLIALDDGHGMGTAGKRTPFIPELGRQIKENEFNRAVVALMDADLKRLGFNVLQLAPTDADVPLVTRTNTANRAGADLLVSIHFNALDGIFHGEGKDPDGFSAHVQSSSGNAARFGRIALKHLAGGTKQKNRGLVVQNLHMTRETKMPAVLLELGYMDNKREALLMIDRNFQRECADEIVRAICEYFGVAYKATTATPVSKPVAAAPKKPTASKELYRVRKSWKDAASQVGAFHDLDAAIDLAKRHAGYEVYNEAGGVAYQKAAAKPAPAAPKYVIPTGILRMGSRGVQVTRLQICLNAAGFKLKGNTDGIFGADTLQALKRFQSVHGNPADGVYGAGTKAALERVVNK